MSRVRKGAETDLPGLRQLWGLCFPEDAEFNEHFFCRMYAHDAVRLIEYEGKAAAALYVFPYSVVLPQGGKLKAWYIYGVGTHPSFRGRGLAGELIEYTLDEARRQGVDLCMLVPQNKGLFEFYKRFQFSPAFFFDEEIFGRENVPTGNARRAEPRDISELNFLYENNLAGKAHVERSEREWRLILTQFEMAGGGIYVLEEDGAVCAYCTWAPERGELTVREVFAENKASKNALLSSVCQSTGAEKLRLFTPGKGEPYGSVYPISRAARQIDFSSAYMNLMHS